MLMYALIGLSLVLTGIVGLQFTYLFYVDRIYRERKKYLRSLEQKHLQLTDRLEAAERRVAEQNDMLAKIYPETGMEDEAWADVIEER
jgi:uncharacterized C2H2 Zn-finger protein